MSDSKNYHNQGQKDSSKGEYKPPHGILDDLTTWRDHSMKKMNEENKSYKDGYRNNQSQKK